MKQYLQTMLNNLLSAVSEVNPSIQSELYHALKDQIDDVWMYANENGFHIENGIVY